MYQVMQKHHDTTPDFVRLHFESLNTKKTEEHQENEAQGVKVPCPSVISVLLRRKLKVLLRTWTAQGHIGKVCGCLKRAKAEPAVTVLTSSRAFVLLRRGKQNWVG